MATGEDEMNKAGKRVAGKSRDESSSRKGPAVTQHKERKGKADTETKARKRKAPFVL